MIETPEKVLAELAAQIRVCSKCGLSQQRIQAVPGEGNARAEIMFIGEAPGKNEDEQGRPFIGQSGKFLTSMIEEIGLRREDVFIGNVIRCRPPENRDPLPHELTACDGWLRAQLRIIQPRVVCTLGRYAMIALIDPYMQISKVHGTPIEKDGTLFIPLYHPAAALHQAKLRDTLIDDMRKVRAELQRRGLWQSRDK